AHAEALKIGLSLPTQREERWVRDKANMVSKAKELGVELKVQITDNDAAKQISQVENLLAQGIKVLIVAAHDTTSAAVIVEKAHKAGVKLIAYDRLIMNSDVDVFLSFDNFKVGEMQGEYLTQLVPKGQYLVLSGSPTDSNAAQYRDGAMKFIKPLVDKGQIKIVMDQAVKDWQPSEAQKLTEQALTANKNKIDAILAPNDGTAGGCIQALAAQKLAGKVPVTGQDAELSAAIRVAQGTQSMTVYKDTRQLGSKAIELAVKLAKGESIAAEVNKKIDNKKIQVPSILLAPIVVDKNNLDKVLIDSGYLKREQVYKKI
ncbi:MAG: sugar ABC transporter substrate-binding protein, partial [Proteobacteria bacterium]|nr:sugar ABC transporter substrate-binding protein [Pseudomonadota bacterium]